MRTNIIIHGDCIDELKKIPAQAIDLIFADPPYNMQLKNPLYRPNNTKVDGVDDPWDKFDSFAEYDLFCTAWLTECRRILKDSGSIWVIGSYHNIFRIGNIMLNLGFWILNDVTWYKANPMPNFMGTRFTNATETLLWCSKSERCKKYTFNHKMMKRYNNDKQMTSVWKIGLCTGGERIKGADGKKAHSTQKPEELLKRVILSSTRKDDVVLDPFFGTGTTGTTAKKLGRKFIGIERDGDYVKIAQDRIDSVHTLWEEAGWIEEEQGRRTRVPFESLVKEKMIRAGDVLYARKDCGVTALVLENGTLQYKGVTGSIHKIGAMIQQTPFCNGWKFWYTVKNNRSRLIDELRDEYMQKHCGL
ncbi:MAG: site-specific DNA-methyltransferase [Spirochaetaceae bacterium]|jgi:DNA modification methylase|nr:site-specific DNA-methyltransferase [Spirochaetaceae bacterium]